MTTLGGKTTPDFFDAKSLVASIAHELLAAPPELGTLAEIQANLLAALFQDDDAHDTCSLVACLNPLHPGPCKGWKGTLFDTAPGAWHSLEAAKVEKANATRVKKIAALKAEGKPIPKKLLTPIVAKPHPHAGTTANKASGGAHVAGKEVSANAGVSTNTPGKVSLGQAIKSLAPVEKGPKGKKPTVMSKGIAHVIAQEKVTPAYKLAKAESITPEQWAGLSEADQATIRGELSKIKIDGFGPQQKKADELLAKLPAGAQPKADAVPGTAKVSLADLANSPKPQPKLPTPSAVKAPEPAPAPKLPEPEAPEAPKLGATGKPKAPKKALFSVEYNGHTVTRTSAHEYTHASVVQQGHGGPTGVWGFHKSEANAMKVPFTAAQKAKGWKVIAALPVTKHESGKLPKPDEKAAPKVDVPEAPKVSEPKTPEAPKVGGTSAQVKALQAIGEAIPGVNLGSMTDTDKLTQVVDKLKESGPLTEHSKMKLLVSKLANAALKTASADQMPGLGHGDKDDNITTFHKDINDHIEQGKPGLPPLVAKMAKHHEEKKNGGVSKGVEDAAKAAHQEKVDAAKAGTPDPQKLADLADPLAPPKVNADTTAMTPTNLVKKIQKDGSADVILGGQKIKVGFNGAGHEGKLTQVTGIGSGTGHYVVTTKSGEKFHLAKGEHVTVANTTSPVVAPKIEIKPMKEVSEDDAVKAIQDAAKAKTPVTTANAKHVDDAIAMANGTAPGASWSKNQLVAYQALSGKEFDALDPAVQDKIVADLEKAQTKFLDPKKVTAAKKLLETFGHGDGSLATTPKAPEPVKPDVKYADALKDPDLSDAQAKKLAAAATPADLFATAQKAAGLSVADNPDNPEHIGAADDIVNALMASKTKFYSKAVLDDPEAKKALMAYNVAALKEQYALNIAAAKAKAFNKINLKTKTENNGLTPLEKASLVEYGNYLLKHEKPDTSAAKLGTLNANAITAEHDLADALNAALKKANAPDISGMSNAQIKDAAADLLDDIAMEPKVNLNLKELQYLGQMGKAKADTVAKGYSPEILNDPVVQVKLGKLSNAYHQDNANNASIAKLDDHLKQTHLAVLEGGTNKDGSPLSTKDKAVIAKHAEFLKASHDYLYSAKTHGEKNVADAEEQFKAAAEKAEKKLNPPEPQKLSDYDQATIDEVYKNAWAKAATATTVYGAKGYGTKTAMAKHPQYESYKQDITELRDLAGKLAVAHGHETTAKLNLDYDEDGNLIKDAASEAYDQAAIDRGKLEKQFNDLRNVAQKRLDAIRVDNGLAKRALPKLDSPAVKTAAAESAYYKTAGYNGPLHGKQASAKQYLVAKVGPKLGTAHKTSSDKAAEKAAKTAPPTADPKIKNAPGTPVTLGDTNAAVGHLPDALKKEITSNFKGMPKGKYLADPTEDVYDNLVNLAAAHTKMNPGTSLSVLDVVKSVDEQHSKTLGVPNAQMMEKKVTDWLGTPAGKAYAEANSTANAKVVKQMTGEIDLPPGVTLKPGEKVQPLAGPGAHDTSLKPSDFKGHTSHEAESEQAAYMKAQGLKWTQGQKTAMTAYTGNGSKAYNGINNYLRGKQGYDPIVKQYALDIQSAMMPLRENTLLKRGTSFSGLPFDEKSIFNMVGGTFEDKGFTSSSVAGSGGHFSGQSLQLVIEAPVGTPAVFVNGISHYKGSENEMLLAAGTKFKILSVEKTSSGHVLARVRVVGDK